MRRLGHAAVIVAIAVTTVIGPARGADAYSTTWTKSQALNYAGDGLWERYVFGGAKFRNNNYWDSDEGIDCSGYVAKVWAVDRYTYPMTFYHPYSTYNFYYGFPYEVFKDRSRGQLLNAWTYRSGSGGPGDHMGLFISQNSNGSWQMYEARGSSYGVVVTNRYISTLINWNYRRTDRRDWYYS